MEQKKLLFRRQSLDGISSPEQLDDYLKVTTPGLWVSLTALLFLLVGILVWSFLGTLNTTVTFRGKAENGIVTIDTAEQISSLDVGDKVKILDEEGVILTLTDYEENNRHFHRILVRTTLPDGEYPVEIVTEHISPYTFLFSEDV